MPTLSFPGSPQKDRKKQMVSWTTQMGLKICLKLLYPGFPACLLYRPRQLCFVACMLRTRYRKRLVSCRFESPKAMLTSCPHADTFTGPADTYHLIPISPDLKHERSRVPYVIKRRTWENREKLHACGMPTNDHVATNAPCHAGAQLTPGQK